MVVTGEEIRTALSIGTIPFARLQKAHSARGLNEETTVAGAL